MRTMRALLSGLLISTVIAMPTLAQSRAAPSKAALGKLASDGGPDAQPLATRDRWLPQSVPTSDTVLRIPVPAALTSPRDRSYWWGAGCRRHRRCGAARERRRHWQDDYRGAAAGRA